MTFTARHEIEQAQHPHRADGTEYVKSHEYRNDGRWYVIGEWTVRNRHGDEDPYMLTVRFTPGRELQFVRWNYPRDRWEPCENSPILPALATTLANLNLVPEFLSEKD